MEHEHGDRCGRCVTLIDFFAVTGLLLRHIDRKAAGDKIAFFYLRTMKELCPEVRAIVEAKEREVDPDFLVSLSSEQGGESAISHIVELIYEGP